MCTKHVPNVLPHLIKYGQLSFPKLENIDLPEKSSFTQWQKFGENWY
jgi:hypothetical protein